MKSKNYSLENILDLEKWETLQDALAEVTRLAILTVNYKGTPITKHSGCSDFCNQVRNDNELAKRCEKCDSRGGFEAVCNNHPYIYFCHYGIVDIAIPISINDKYVGAVMAGQVRLSDHGSLIQLEQLHSSPTGLSALEKSTELQRMYNQLPFLSYKRVCSISNMLFHLCNYIVEQAVNRNYLLDMYENLAFVEERFGSQPTVLQRNINNLKTSLSNAISSTYLASTDNTLYPSRDSRLYPVVEYINANRSKMVTLNEAASLIHLSPGHFSRLFSREFGQNFTTYMTHLKIEWAKQLLIKTNLSVTQISEELGFSEPGYFIKIFKREEGMTPLAYRNTMSRTYQG